MNLNRPGAAGTGRCARVVERPAPIPRLGRVPATDSDIEALTVLLGRVPRGGFEIVVRDETGAPVVIRNSPLLDDGTPMPTRYWLVDPDLVTRVSRIESAGGVRASEASVDGDELKRAHEHYAAERDADLPADHVGPRPHGGVGGTQRGVKCLHAHYAHLLAGGDDPIGRWVAVRLAAVGERAEGEAARGGEA